jgi:hypothetical protein
MPSAPALMVENEHPVARRNHDHSLTGARSHSWTAGRVSVNAYMHADPTLKQRALDRLTPINPTAKPGRYKPSDDLLAFLEAL